MSGSQASRQRSPALSREEIEAAFHALVAKLGRVPTNQAVREELGRGSLTTIAPVVKALREQVVGPRGTPARALSPSTVAAIQRELEQVEAEARSGVLEELAGVRSDYDALVDQMRELEEQVAELSERSERLAREVAEKDGENRTLRGEAEKERRAREDALRAAEKARTDLAEAQWAFKQLAEVKEERDRLRAAAEAAVQARQEVETKHAIAEEAARAKQAEVEQTQAREQKLAERVEAMEARLTEAERRVADEVAARQRLEAERDALTARVDEIRSDCANASKQAEEQLAWYQRQLEKAQA